MGATLGQDTINKGVWAVGVALLPSWVSCWFITGSRVRRLRRLACQFAVDHRLHGGGAGDLYAAWLAGLVLMLGMAVDANVLIYERLREERDRGASLALAIRNGYDRAFPTIIDTHLSSIFTANRPIYRRQRSAQRFRCQPHGRVVHQLVHFAVHDAADVRHLVSPRTGCTS